LEGYSPCPNHPYKLLATNCHVLVVGKPAATENLADLIPNPERTVSLSAMPELQRDDWGVLTDEQFSWGVKNVQALLERRVTVHWG
jgi:hypothetical protein